MSAGQEGCGARKDGEYDLFLSHATPDKAWIRTLAGHLEALGLRVFVDSLEIDPGDNWVVRLSDGLQRSRYLVLALSTHTDGRPWVIQEWTSYLAGKGPFGRLLPVRIDAVELPFILGATQAIDALDRDANAAADALFKVVGDPATLPASDARRLVLGRDLPFTLSRDEGQVSVTTPGGETRQGPLPWKADSCFRLAHLEFTRLQQCPLRGASDRADLLRHARTLGSLLFEVLFDEAAAKTLGELIAPDRPRPVVRLRSDDALLLSLPWELLHHEDRFLVGESALDLVRTTLGDVDGQTLLREPTTPFKLAVNVSAPEGSGLSHEAESYRITLATAERCEMAPTELGTLDDLVDTVVREQPTGIHFSGHGAPGALQFESDEGGSDVVGIETLITTLRNRLPDDRRLPPFFYLASCHGNEPMSLEEDDPGSASAAVQLHQAGVTEVVGYFGPIADALSTRAEETLYEAIAEGLPTRDAVRLAREALKRPFHEADGRHRPGATRSATTLLEDASPGADTPPFAWAQLVYYHRGPEWPLSVKPETGKRPSARLLRREFQGFLDRKVLQTGFIGRRLEQHRLRRRIRQGERVFVLQGLGGLGKSTLAQQLLPWLVDDAEAVCTLWCQEVEQETNKAEALVAQLLAWCRARFGLDWEGVVQQVDQACGDDAAKRFLAYLQVLMQNTPALALYLDNLESLLVGPKDDASSETFGQWAEPALAIIWQNASAMARDGNTLCLVASCRYRNDDFADALLPVSPLPPDALFRLTEWFPALQRLSAHGRAALAERLDGHPRAVEYADDLVRHALTRWRSTHGEWSLSIPPTGQEVEREWAELVAPALPQVEQQLEDNLLLQAIWERVLDDRARDFLYRMTVLRRPVEWRLLGLLGDEDESEADVFATAERLRDTSLLEQLEVLRATQDKVATVARYTLHPAAVQFIRQAHAEAPALLLGAHRRLGEHLEAEARDSPYIETDIEAGHHLFEADEFDRACELLGTASSWLQNRGRVREGLRVLAPFLDEVVLARIGPVMVGGLLGAVGGAHRRLGEVQKAIGYYEQALVIAREIGDRRGEGGSLGNLGLACARLGEVQTAIGYYEQALVIAREIGDRQGEGSSLGNLGLAYARLGEVQKAIGYHEQQLAITRETRDRQGEGNALGSLGNACARLGEVQNAIGYYEQALVIAREIGDRQGEGNALGNLGLAYANLGEIQKAIGYYEQGLIIDREIGDRQGEGTDLGNIGIAYARLGEVRKAIGYYEQGVVIAREIRNRQGESAALGNLGNAFRRLGEVRKAIGYYEQQFVIDREIRNRQGEGNALGNLGIAYARLGDVRKAIGYHEQQLVITREIRDRRGEGNALGSLGNACARLGEVQNAIGYYEQALVIAREIGDRHGEGSALGNLGITYANLGEAKKAVSLLRQAKTIGEQIADPRLVEVVTSTFEQLRQRT